MNNEKATSSETNFPSSIDFPTKLIELKIGTIDFEIECLRSLDESVDLFFDELKRIGREDLLETLTPYFAEVWPASVSLTRHLFEKLPSLKKESSRILELGCGLALPSLLYSHLNFEVTATDFHPDIPKFLEKNAKRNSIRLPKFVELDWKKPEALTAKNFDLIVGSDLLYEKDQPVALANTIETFLKPGGTAIVSDPERPYLQIFSDEMRRRNFKERIETSRDNLEKKEIFILTFLKK